MYVPLHCHSHYSLLDGLARLPDMAQAAADWGMPAVALTDHGNLYGLMPFLEACHSAGVKPICGVEFYFVGNRHQKESMDRDHLVLLAKDDEGLHNLCRLVSLSNLEGFYYKPRIDWELLGKYRQGLIALSACLAGTVSRAICGRDMAGAEATARRFRDIFGEDFYLEVQRHDISEVINHPDGRVEEVNFFDRVVDGMLELRESTGIKIVATSDSHYLRAEDADAQRMLTQISTKGKLEFGGDTFRVYSPNDMDALWIDHLEVLETTLEVCAKIQPVHIAGDVEVPRLAGITDEQDVLKRRALAGLEARYGRPLPHPYAERLTMELGVVEETGFARYILFVADICDFARRAGIRFGPRGSAAGSIICHGLGISEPDPIRHGLLFERFLNPARVEVPDIDLDFQDDRRGEVREYIRKTYGEDRVASIMTLSRMAPKMAVRDVARAKGLAFMSADALSKRLGQNSSFEKALQDREFIKALEDPSFKEVVDAAVPLEGTPRNVSTHAAGIVISAKPLLDCVPLERVKDSDQYQVQVEMDYLSKAGLIKMDCLGVDYLSVLDRTIKLIAEQYGVTVDPWQLPWDDEAVWEMLKAGRTHGVFQLSSAGMRRWVKELQPHSIAELTALVALYRPGPLENIPRYVAVKWGKEEVDVAHPIIEDVVRETNGIIIYQEQIMQIARLVAGYSLGQADILRKAVGKKKRELLLAQRDEFIARAQTHSGIGAADAERIWNYFEPFARYGFNKAHACCYAYLSYQTAWLKANYPHQYMACLLTVVADQQEKVAAAVTEALAMGIEVLPPSANKSAVETTIEEGKLRLGLGVLKGLGDEPARVVVEQRPYRRPADVPTKLVGRLTSAQLDLLIRAGAFDFKRGPLRSMLEPWFKAGKRKIAPGQIRMWDATFAVVEPDNTLPDEPITQLLAWEKELIGVYLTDNPIRRAMQRVDSTPVADLPTEGEVTVVGELVGAQMRPTKNGDQMGVGSLMDTTGMVTLVAFPRTYAVVRELWESGRLVVVTGQMGTFRDEPQIQVNSVLLYEEPREETATAKGFHLTVTDNLPSWLAAWHLARANPGTVPLDLTLRRGKFTAMLSTRVTPSTIEAVKSYGTVEEV